MYLNVFQNYKSKGEDNYAFEMDNENGRPAWRYPHLMFRDSRKSHNKSVSFKKTGALKNTIFYLFMLFNSTSF